MLCYKRGSTEQSGQGRDGVTYHHCRISVRVINNTRHTPDTGPGTSDSKEIQPVHPKGNEPWVCTAKTDADAEAPVLWPPDAKSWLTGKDPDTGRDWGQEEKGMTEDEMVGWHYWLHGHKSEQTRRDSEGQGSLACCSSWGHKEPDRT